LLRLHLLRLLHFGRLRIELLRLFLLLLLEKLILDHSGRRRDTLRLGDTLSSHHRASFTCDHFLGCGLLHILLETLG
jgi:hypothetical protein